MAKRYKTECSIKMIWGLAKSAELTLSDEELYLLIQRETKKSSMRELTKKEVVLIVGILQQMKDSVKGKKNHASGNLTTQNQRRKLFKLSENLGWNQYRLNAMAKRMFGIENVEWLDYLQCSKLIEALKKMDERRNEN